MKKYFYIFKAEIMSTLQYLGNIILNSVSYFIIIAIFIYLWDYIYEDPAQIINGYTKNQMIWYVIFTEILWKIFNGRKFSRRISDDVKSGNIAYNINRPYNYIYYALASHLGEGFVTGIIYVIIGFVLGSCTLGDMPRHTIVSILILIVSSLLAILIDAFIIIFLSLFSFFMEDSKPLYWIYSKSQLVLGIIFPVEFFPGIMKYIISATPIFVTCYGPAKLFTDFSYKSAAGIIFVQIVYLLIAITLCLSLYKKGVKKLNVNGG